MSDVGYVQRDDAWREFCQRYLVRNSFCMKCEEKGQAVYSSIVYQPTPHEDKEKTRYKDYNLQALCSECYLQIQTRSALNDIKWKAIHLAAVLIAVGLLIELIF